jgi:hypothetical protein
LIFKLEVAESRLIRSPRRVAEPSVVCQYYPLHGWRMMMMMKKKKKKKAQDGLRYEACFLS